MEKITIVIEKSKDFYDAFSENCDGIYAAGESIEAVKKDVEHAISILKKYPANQQPAPLRGEYEIEWKFDVQSFLEYYKDYLSLAGLEKITGINQELLPIPEGDGGGCGGDGVDERCNGLGVMALSRIVYWVLVF